jgi:hypothetical protein
LDRRAAESRALFIFFDVKNASFVHSNVGIHPIKARGMGLAHPLDRFSFHYPHEHGVKIIVDKELDVDGNRWSFWQFQPTQEHLLSVRAERLGSEAPVLTIRRTIPTVEDAMMAERSLSVDRSHDNLALGATPRLKG